MKFLGFLERGDENASSINWYCENCNDIYYKYNVSSINMEKRK
jgi:hypothetical protein